MNARSKSLSYYFWSSAVAISIKWASFLALVFAATAFGQNSASPPVALTADQDRQNMMDQLDIKALRPGYSGNEKAPNHAN